MNAFLSYLELAKEDDVEYFEFEDVKRNIVVTGDNGSGKTYFLESLAKQLEDIIKQRDISDNSFIYSIGFNPYDFDLSDAVNKGEFIVAYYDSYRKLKMEIPKHVEKVVLKAFTSICERQNHLFLKYLLDMKATQVFALANGDKEKVEMIEQ